MPEMRPVTGQTNACRQPSAPVRIARAAAIRASSGRRRSMNAALGPPACRAIATRSIDHARGATAIWRESTRPPASRALSVATGPASRSNPTKKPPSAARLTGAPSSVSAAVPRGAVPRSQPPCVGWPE